MNETGMINPTASAYAGLIRKFAREETSKITRDELHLIFQHCAGSKIGDNAAYKVASFLRHRGFDLKKLRFGNKFTPGIEVTWTVNAADREAIDNDLNEGKVPSKIKRVK